MGVDGLELNKREQAISSNLYTSASAVSHALEILDLSDVRPGETVVDLASGASGLTDYLLSKEVDAYGVDRLYLEGGKNLGAAIEHYRIWLDSEYGQYYPDSIPLIEESMEAFLLSFRKNPQHYLGGWLTEPPVQANFAKRTVSLYGLLDMAEDSEVLDAAVERAIEITQSGGIFVVAPLYEGWGQPDYYRTQHEELIAKLRAGNIGEVRVEKYHVQDYRGPSGHRLKVIKA